MIHFNFSTSLTKNSHVWNRRRELKTFVTEVTLTRKFEIIARDIPGCRERGEVLTNLSVGVYLMRWWTGTKFRILNLFTFVISPLPLSLTNVRAKERRSFPQDRRLTLPTLLPSGCQSDKQVLNGFCRAIVPSTTLRRSCYRSCNTIII